MRQNIAMSDQVRSTFETPLGELELVANDHALLRINFGPAEECADLPLQPNHPILSESRRQLEEYFDGKRREFDIPLEPKGTAFQETVWAYLQKIPFATTTTYLKLATKLGSANVVRAVGAANGKNPIPIIIPCHRVIGADGSLVGFSGGLDKKQYLLALEGATANLGQPQLF